jgi:excisionase family DNA binding protein
MKREVPMSGDRLLTLREVSERTGLAIPTLREMRRDGRGPDSFRLGTRVKVRESALEKWVAEAEAAEQARRTGGAAEQENANA